MDRAATIAELKARIAQLESQVQACAHTEEALRASEERHRALIDTIPYGIQENNVDGFITFSNRAHHRICGYDDDELIGKAVWDLVADPAEKASLPELLKNLAVHQPPPHPYYSRYRTREGRVIDIQVDWNYKRDAQGRVIGFISVITDITDQLKASKALQISEQRYRTLFEKAGDAIFLIAAEGPHKGKILDANQAAADMHGYSTDELKALSIKDLDDPKAAGQVDGRLERLLKGEWLQVEVAHRKKDGTVFPVEVNAGLVSLGDRPVILGIDRDITVRKDIERCLKESEMRYRAIFEGSGEGILLADIATLQFRFANPAVCEFLGYSQQEMVRLSVGDIHPEKDLPWIMAEFKSQAEGEKILAPQIPCLRKDGTVVYADIRTGCIGIGGREYLVGFFADVTEQRGIKAALAEQVSFLQSLIDTLPNPIFYKDAQGRYLGCNRAFEQFMGLDKKSIVGKTVYDIAPKDLADVYHKADATLLASQKAQIYEADVRYADGQRHEVIFNKAAFYHSDGSLGGLVGAMVDVTDLKRAVGEKTLLATAIEQTPEMIIITDLDTRIHYTNPAFERITGYSRKEALGQTPAILQSGAHSESFYQEIWEKLSGGKVWKGRITNRRKDGTLFEVEATILPVQQQDGRVTDYLAVERDISQELVREKQLRQSQKMEAIGTLAGGIAHDFNNILSAIIGFTEISMHDLPPEAKSRTYLGKVLTAGDRARELVNQILAFSRATEQESRPVVVKHIIKETLKLLQATLPSTIHITSRLDAAAATMADPIRIHQVVMNLCTNAAHAMQSDGGRLTVSLDELQLNQEVARRHAALPEGLYLALRVEDTGCGIEPEIIDRIFDPFFTTKGQGEGTGMGLSVVHGIVQGFGGSIHVESTVSRGSTFEVLLPVIESCRDLIPKPEEPLHVGSERIMFIDDEPFQVELGEQLLQLLGYRVTAVDNSQQALALFREQPEAFDLVITDMTMPGLTGDELAKQLLAVRPGLPVIICTGYSHKLNQASIKDLGIAGLVYKPLIMKELAQVIRQTLDRE